MKFKPLSPTSRLGRRKRFLERGRAVRIPMVPHHRDPFGGGIVLIGKHTHRFGPVGACTPLRARDLAPAGERLGKQEQLRRAVRIPNPHAAVGPAQAAEANGSRSLIACSSHPGRSPDASAHKHVDTASGRLPGRRQTRRCVPGESPHTLLSEAAARLFQCLANRLLRDRSDLLDCPQLVGQPA